MKKNKNFNFGITTKKTGLLIMMFCLTATMMYAQITLPWTEDWESVSPTTTFTSNTTGINGATEWDYNKTASGRLQYTVYAHGGSKAAAVDANPAGAWSINYLIANLDIAAYAASTDLELSFWHRNYGEEDQANDRVWIRGSNTDSWIQVYDLFDDDANSNWVEVTGIDVDVVISGAGQTITSTFQLRFGQEDNASFTGDGRVFDDILLEGTSAPSPPNCTTPVSPLDGATGIATSGNLEWNTVAGATGYKLWFGTDGGGTTDPVNIVAGTDQGNVLTYAYTNLAYSTIHYWKIVPYNASGDATGCSIWDFTSGATPITLPWLEDWESVGPTTTFTSNTNAINGATEWDYSKTNNGRLRFASYYHGGSQGATCDASPNGTFSINHLTANLNIAAYASSTGLELSFWHRNYGEEDQANDRVWIRGSNSDAWIQVYDLFDDDATSGWVEITGIDIDAAISGAGQTITSTFQLRFGQEDNYGTTSDGRVFDDILLEEPAPPSCTTPVSPLNGTTGVAVSGNLEWNTVADATGYKLWFGTDGGGTSDPTNIVNGTDLGNVTTYAYSGLTYHTVHYWKIVPYNGLGDATGCSIWDFTTGGVPGLWTGTTSTDWSTGTNWDDGNVPGSGVDVTIPASATNWPVYTGNFALGTDCNDMVMEGNSELNVTGNLYIPLYRTLTCNGANGITVAGNWDNGGTFTTGTGTVTFSGNSQSTTTKTCLGAFFTDDFEDGNVTEYCQALGWSSSTDFAYTGTRSGKMTGVSGHRNGARLCFNGEQPVYFSFWVRTADITNPNAYFVVRDAAGKHMTMFYITAGNLKIYVTSSISLTTPATQNYWHLVEFKNVDWTAKTFDLYYDGTLHTADVPFRDAATTSLSTVDMYNYLVTNTSYYDDIYIGVSVAATEGFYNLLIDKTNAEVTLNCDVQVNNNFTIKELSDVTTSTGTTLTIDGGELLLESDATGTASFIDNGNVTYNTGGEAKVERHTTTSQWQAFSPSVSGETAGMFHYGGSITFDVWLMEHNEPTDAYSYIFDVNTNLNPFQGYFVWGDGSSVTPSVSDWTYEMNGELNTGSFGSTDNLTRTSSAPFDTLGWNYLGNPYPCALDWYSAYQAVTTNNVDATVYVYNYPGWATWNNSTGGTNGGSQYIALGQSFFVNVSAPGTGTFIVDNADRVHNNTPYLKSEIANKVNLQVKGTEFTDETVIVFREGATPGFDSKFDAYKLFSMEDKAPQIYSLTATNMAVNVLPSADWVQLGFQAGISGDYTISATEINDIPSVWLEDTFTGEFTDLTSDSYTFYYSTENNADRFIVHFLPMSTPEKAAELFNIYSYNKGVYVSVPENTRGNIVIYNMIGQEVASAPINSVLNKITLEKSAYYVVKVLNDESIVTKKVFIK